MSVHEIALSGRQPAIVPPPEPVRPPEIVLQRARPRSGVDTPGSRSAAAGWPFTILLVCTGNLCRSVAAEILLARELSRVAPGQFEIASVGTAAAPGHPVHPLTEEALADFGLSAARHRSHPLVPQAVELADLVLTAKRSHRNHVLQFAPDALRRTFTLVEFARLCTAVGTEGLDPWQLVTRIAGNRGHSAVGDPTGDDIADPVSGDAAVHRECVTRIASVVEVAAGALLGHSRG